MRELIRSRPAVELPPTMRSVGEAVREWWIPRRLAVMAILWPLTAAITWAVAGDVRSAAVIGVISFGTALSLTTYTPAPGQTVRQVLGSPCASVGGVVPALFAVSVLTWPAANASIAVALLIYSLAQRFAGSEACRLPARNRDQGELSSRIPSAP